VLDGLASYAYLRKVGYEAKNITVIGNSAGGGLSWSILSYLVAIDQAGKGSLGVPRAVAMISVSRSAVDVN
jgi:acetyl esterase/lipase